MGKPSPISGMPRRPRNFRKTGVATVLLRPTISLKPANYFLFRKLNFFVFFVFLFFWFPIATITGFMVGNFLVCNLS